MLEVFKKIKSILSQSEVKPHSPLNNSLSDSFCIKNDYTPRGMSKYFDDSLVEAEGIVHQPDVYQFAAFLGRRFGCSHVIDLGCGKARKLVGLYPEFHIIGIDYGGNIRHCQEQYPYGTWIEFNLEQDINISLDRNIIQNAVIICADVIEHLNNPLNLLKAIKVLLNDSPVAILTTPERDLVHGADHLGPPPNPSHVREWSLPELERFLKANGLNICFSGLTVNNNRDLEKKTAITVLGNNSKTKFTTAPDVFKVVAFMCAFNEGDIVAPSVSYLINQGVDVYLIDNWSTDNTIEQVQHLIGKGLIGIERFPQDGPTLHYNWRHLLGRVEELSRTIEADWFIHHDVDEIRESPWPQIRLKDAICHVDCSGFNAIDHTVINFPPIDNNFIADNDVKRHFTFFEFGMNPGYFSQVKAWKNLRKPISLIKGGGHNVNFDGRRIYPFKFLLRHYPIRSQRHGETKIFLERKARFNPEEKANGWHKHYDQIGDGHIFIREQEELEFFDEQSFHKQYLIERLSGIGIVR